MYLAMSYTSFRFVIGPRALVKFLVAICLQCLPHGRNTEELSDVPVLTQHRALCPTN